MLYCAHCRRLYEAPACPQCHRSRGRPVQPEDLCWMTEKPMLWAGLLEDVLKQNGIPYLKQGRLGAALATTFGPMQETVCFFVPYAYLEEAQALTASLFESSPL